MPLSPLCVVLYFNSRPREEVDSLISSLLLRYISISTHDLTRRSTRKQTIYNNLERIFQLTTSRGGRLARREIEVKKEIFQLTTSQGGRLARFSNPIRNELFQLTTSQGGRHNIILLDSAGNSFQLTTSQGGRPGTEKRSHQAPCISTLDLTRRSTGNCGASSATGYISTHDLMKRSTSFRCVL